MNREERKRIEHDRRRVLRYAGSTGLFVAVGTTGAAIGTTGTNEASENDENERSIGRFDVAIGESAVSLDGPLLPQLVLDAVEAAGCITPRTEGRIESTR